MKTNNVPSQRPANVRHDRRTSARAEIDAARDPYHGSKKLHDGTVCPQCGAVYHAGRWQWAAAKPDPAISELCAACRRINDQFPAGIVTLHGAFALAHKDEILRLARHQEEAEKTEHPLNRIIDITDDAAGITINTTDIHLPRRIGEAVERAYRGELTAHFEEDGYFVRVRWNPPA